MKLNPYEQGLADYKNKVKQGNPFPVFSARWAMYNRGYNSIPYAALTKPVDNNANLARG